MKSNTDTVVKRIVEGLTSVEPPRGLEERVLARVRARQASRATWLESLRWHMRGLPLAWALPATVVTAAAVILILHTHRGIVPQQAAHLAPGFKAASQPLDVKAPTSVAAPVRSITARVSRMRYTSASPAPEIHNAANPATTRDYDQLAMEEWRAPSQPAPELPLTHEERLLQHYARRGDTEELAALTPAFRAAERVREQTEFQQFFSKKINGDKE